jgi:hypothetical protein
MYSKQKADYFIIKVSHVQKTAIYFKAISIVRGFLVSSTFSELHQITQSKEEKDETKT